ncbi:MULTISPECIES: ROK family protein [Streptomyces]|uniref:ROK family protein n=1 Tax=Streptomyces TaxID=1883 RepID=UPI001F1814C4|nr:MULTISPECIES: ROK family protein [Streptomyces]
MGGTKVAFRTETSGTRGAASRDSVVRWRSSAGLPEDLDTLRAHVEELLARAARPLAGVGVAVPATLDAAGRVTAWPTRPSWVGLDLSEVLRDLFPGSEVSWADDGDLAAVAEAHAAGHSDLVYVGVGTGIGGGIVLGGRPVPGTRRGSCELGHLIVDRDGELCDCGRRGCVQAEASGPATLRRAAAARGAEVTFEELRAGYADGADWAVTAVEHSCAALAAALVGAGELVHPSATVVGGGFAAGIEGFVAEVARQAAMLARPGHPVAPVLPARLGGGSSLHGALLAARGLPNP